jgi:Tfp pilus assembly protein PilP
MKRFVLTSMLVCISGTALSDTPPATPAPAAPKPATATAKPVVPAKDTPIQEARKRVLVKDDFTESDTNRDPFRSFLASFAVQQARNVAHPILLEKFAIDELKLAGIITGEIQPRAMFIDPSGQGVTVVRGNHISKADAVVTRVAADRVYLRIEEDTGPGGDGKPRVVERQIELHAGELSQ